MVNTLFKLVMMPSLFFHFIDCDYVFLFPVRINDYGSEPFYLYFFRPSPTRKVCQCALLTCVTGER